MRVLVVSSLPLPEALANELRNPSLANNVTSVVGLFLQFNQSALSFFSFLFCSSTSNLRVFDLGSILSPKSLADFHADMANAFFFLTDDSRQNMEDADTRM